MLAKLRQLHSEVDLAYDLVQQFAQLLRTRTGKHFDAWLDQVANSKLPKLQSFAAGIEKDKDGVKMASPGGYAITAWLRDT